MKTLRILTLLTLVLAIGLTSCSSDSDEGNPLESQILGSWSGEIPAPNPNPDPDPDPVVVKSKAAETVNIYVAFENSNTGKIRKGESTVLDPMTYQINGSLVTLTISSTKAVMPTTTFKVVSIDEEKMAILFLDKNGIPRLEGQTFVFTKASN